MVHTPRLIFMGTPDFAVPTLRILVEHGYNVVSVYTQPPRPKNRGHQVTKSPVHLFAEEHHLPVFTPLSLKEEKDQRIFAAQKPDLGIVVAYGLILPKVILEIPRLGCVNIHGSLLPRWRGASPIHRAMLAGDDKTGITLMHMDEGLDTGDMITSEDMPLHVYDTFSKIHDSMSLLGAQLLLKSLEQILEGGSVRIPQSSVGVTYAQKLSKQEGVIDWQQSATVILRCINVLNPWPGTTTLYKGHSLKIKAASFVEKQRFVTAIQDAPHRPGMIFPGGYVLCGDGELLSLDIVQKEGGKPLLKEDFLRGFPLEGSFS